MTDILIGKGDAPVVLLGQTFLFKRLQGDTVAA